MLQIMHPRLVAFPYRDDNPLVNVLFTGNNSELLHFWRIRSPLVSLPNLRDLVLWFIQQEEINQPGRYFAHFLDNN